MKTSIPLKSRLIVRIDHRRTEAPSTSIRAVMQKEGGGIKPPINSKRRRDKPRRAGIGLETRNSAKVEEASTAGQ